MPRRRKRTWYDIPAYRFVPQCCLFDLGDELGLLEEDPVQYVIQGLAPYEEDGSVYMTPKQARKMVKRCDYMNYRLYALRQDGTEVLGSEPALELCGWELQQLT